MLRPPSHSRFGITDPITTDQGIETFGTMREFPFLNRDNLDPKDILHTPPITSDVAGKLDLLSLQIYGYTDLDWVFVFFNNVTDPLGYPQIGTIVEYPNPKLVLPLV